MRRRPDSRQPVRSLGGCRTGRPQPFTTGDTEAAQRSRGGQRLGLWYGQLYASRHVEQRSELPVSLSVLDELLGQLVADVADAAETESHLQARVLQRGVRKAGVDV